MRLGQRDAEQAGRAQLAPELAVDAVLGAPRRPSPARRWPGPVKTCSARSRTASCSSVNEKSMAMPPAGSELAASVSSSSKAVNSTSTGMPISTSSAGTPTTLLTRRMPSSSSMRADGERVVERRDLRVVVDHEAVDGAPAAGLDGVPLVATGTRAHRPGRVAQRPAGRAALDQQLPVLGPLEEELVVAGSSTGRGRGILGRGLGSRGLNLRMRNIIEPTSSPSWSGTRSGS